MVRLVLWFSLMGIVLLSQLGCSVCRTRSQELMRNDIQIDIAPESGRSSTTIVRNIERVDLKLRDGTTHSGVLSFLPNTANSTPSPVIIVLGGFETGEKSLAFLRQDIDAVFATVDYPYKAPNERGFVTDLGEVKAIKRAVHRTDLALDALIGHLLEHSKIDRSRMILVGASFGAPFAITAARRNPDIDALILIHAFGRIDLAITQQLTNEWGGWSYPVARLVGDSAWLYLAYPPPEDGVQSLHPNQQVLAIFSNEDEQVPCESTTALRLALTKSRAQVATATSQGGHLGPGKTEIIDELLAMSIQWLKIRRLL